MRILKEIDTYGTPQLIRELINVLALRSSSSLAAPFRTLSALLAEMRSTAPLLGSENVAAVATINVLA